MIDFVKFPRTPHLLWQGDDPPRDDKVMRFKERDLFLSGQVPVIVQEKVDGANLGISVDEDGKIMTQSRGDYFGPCVFRKSHPQFNPLWAWIAEREDALRTILGTDRILFGEWLFAEHSIHYDRLPDWFLAFDIFDRRLPAFIDWDECKALFRAMGVKHVPEIAIVHEPSKELLVGIADSSSCLRIEGVMEGIYLRIYLAGINYARAKIVNPDFTQAIDEHWTKGPLVKNELRKKSPLPGVRYDAWA